MANIKNKTDRLYECLNQPTDTRLQRRPEAAQTPCSRSPRDGEGAGEGSGQGSGQGV